MSKIKKMPKQFLNEIERIEEKFDRYEQLGYKVIRIKQRARLEVAPEKSEMDTVRGFETFGRTDRGFEISVGQTIMYPCTDGHRYGYIPNTKHNLDRLKYVLGSRNLILDDPEFIDFAIEEAEKAGLPTEYKPRTNDLGQTLDKAERDKKHRIAELERLVAQQEMDAKIAELEARLAGIKDKEEDKEVEQAKVDKPKPLAGKTVK